MPKILMLTDRPQEDELLASFAAEVAHRLNIGGLATIVTLSRDMPAGLFPGSPEAGRLPLSSPFSVTAGWTDAVAARRLFASCHKSAAYYGLKSETGWAGETLPFTAVTLGNVANLVVVSRGTLLSEPTNKLPLQTMMSGVAAPLLICPAAPKRWRRIFVATGKNAQRDLMIAWGQHWSRRFDIPFTVIELSSAPMRTVWSPVSNWKPWISRNQRHRKISERMLEYGLDSSDVLLVGRQLSKWRFSKSELEISVDEVIASTTCAVGVVPTLLSSDTEQLIYSRDVESVA